jgi:putative endonuclease
VAVDYKSSLGQVDLIARDRGALVFVEVKTRAGTGFGAPAEGVGTWKRRKLQQLAAAYIKRSGHRGDWRIDVIGVIATPGAAPKLEHIRYALA